MLRGEVSGADDRLSEATLKAFDQWFAAQVDTARRASDSGRARRAGSDDSEAISSPDDQRQTSEDLVQGDPDSWRGSSTKDPDDHDDDVHHDATDSCSLPAYERSPLSLPVLPNRNAVYVADAILPPTTVNGSRDLYHDNGVNRKSEYDADEDVENDLEVVLPSASPSPIREAETEMEFVDDVREDRVAPEMDTFAQEEATDLSLPKQNGDRESESGKNGDAGTADYLSTGGSSSSESGSGAQSPMMQAPAHGALPPPHNFLLNPSAAIAGLFSQSATSLPPFYHQRALQLAAMSRAAALGLPLHGKDVSPVASKSGIRSAHGYVPSIYSANASNIGTGKTVHVLVYIVDTKHINSCENANHDFTMQFRYIN